MPERSEIKLESAQLRSFLRDLADRADDVVKVDIRRLGSGKIKCITRFIPPEERQLHPTPEPRKHPSKDAIGNF
jgi:hypothetical protein